MCVDAGIGHGHGHGRLHYRSNAAQQPCHGHGDSKYASKICLGGDGTREALRQRAASKWENAVVVVDEESAAVEGAVESGREEDGKRAAAIAAITDKQ
jgi:hypothetical protein